MRFDLGESFDLSMQYTYANVDGSEIVDGATLDERYYLTICNKSSSKQFLSRVTFFIKHIL